MREGWESKRLGKVCSVLNGYAFKSSDAIEGSNTQLLRMGNLYQNVLDLDRKPVFYPDTFSETYKKLLLKEGDLIMTLTGTVDKTDYGYTVKIPKLKVDLLLNQRIMKIEVQDLNLLNKDYLKHYLLSPDFLSRLYSTASGTRQANLSSNTILKLNITYPVSLSEQKQIVTILDKAFTAIDQAKANIEKNIQNANELFQSKINGIFSQKGDGWEEKTWNEVIEIRSGRNQKAVENPEGKYPILGSAGKIMNYSDDYLCDEGTTIIGRKGTINNPMYIETKFWNVDTAFGLHALKGLDKKFLYFFCLSYDFTQRDKGSGRPSLVKNDLLKMKMPLPKTNIQQITVEQCEKLNEQLTNLQNEYNKKSNLLEELKKSILQKAFAGELSNKMAEV